MLFLCLSMLDTEEEKDKFTRIYEKYRQLMFYVANRVLNDEDLAEDALQEAFIRVAKNIHRINEEDEPKTRGFLTIIVKNVAVTMLRKTSREIPDDIFLSEHQDDSTAPDVIAEENDTRRHLMAAIARLSTEHREILELVYLHDLKITKAAEICGIMPVTARKRLQRAKAEMRKYLEEEGIHGVKI